MITSDDDNDTKTTAAKIKVVNFDKDATVEDKKAALTEAIDSFGGRRKRNNNAKPTDEKTFTLTRDDCVGLANLLVKHDILVCDFGLMMALAEFALNRPVWNVEFGSNTGLDKELEQEWQELLKRVRSSDEK